MNFRSTSYNQKIAQGHNPVDPSANKCRSPTSGASPDIFHDSQNPRRSSASVPQLDKTDNQRGSERRELIQVGQVLQAQDVMLSQSDVGRKRHALPVVCRGRVNANGNDLTLRGQEGGGVRVDTREVEGGGVGGVGGVEDPGCIRVAAAPP